MKRTISIRTSRNTQKDCDHISASSGLNIADITTNGKEDIVVLSHGDSAEQQNLITESESKTAFYAHLAQATDDLKFGRVHSINDAFDDILSELNCM